MGFLKRLLGGADPERAPEPDDVAEPADGGASSPADDEAARDRELLRADAERLRDELLQRQLRYADRSWTPPAQGGPLRAGDETSGAEG